MSALLPITDADQLALLTGTIAQYRAAIESVRAAHAKLHDHQEAEKQLQSELDTARATVGQIGQEIAFLTSGMTMSSFAELLY